MKKYVVVVAGGNGVRLGSDIPKQFIEVNGKTILEHTLACFDNAQYDLIVVINERFLTFWQELKASRYIPDHQLVAGGSTRSESVLKGIQQLDGNSLTAVHDAARPFLSPEMIHRLFEHASLFGSAVPVVPIHSTIRQITVDGNTITVPREQFVTVQTPQVFTTSHLQAAYHHPQFASFTDEASLMEAMGHEISTVPGETSNLKITYQEDLMLANLLLK